MPATTKKKKTRIRHTGPIIRTRAQADEALGVMAAEIAAYNEIVAQMEQKITTIRQAYEDRFAEIDAKINAASTQLQAFGVSPAGATEMGDKKSIDLMHGRIGFRTSPPAVKARRGHTLKGAVDEVDRPYIRTKRELDRDRILDAHAKGVIDDEDLKDWGLQVVQKETFFVEPKVEEGTTTREG